MMKWRSLSLPIAIFLAFSLLCLFFFSSYPLSSLPLSSPYPIPTLHHPPLKVYVADLPRSFNYGLLDQFWSLSTPDSRIANPTSDPNPKPINPDPSYPPYPDNPLMQQYSAEYWLLGDLETPPDLRARDSVAVRVYDLEESDVVFVPFFATLSAELQLGWGKKGAFLKKDESSNLDYKRQKEVVERIKRSEAWKRSGGRDHVFVLTDPVAMWHAKADIAPAMLLVVDFGGWYKLDSQSMKNGTVPERIQHTQVSLIKDVIVPYTHLLPTLPISENTVTRHILLYFKGAKHRHRGGLVREKLWDILQNEPDVIMEEGFPNSTGRSQSIKGMRSSQFCLHPAGDTPTSCRLFDAVASLCIPVIVSDNIPLPFEGIIDYSQFSLFISESQALQKNYLVTYLRSISEKRKERLRANMARVQSHFEFDNGFPGGVGPVPRDGAVNHIWEMVYQKVPNVRQAILREKRRPEGVVVPLRCHCT
ncbi:putative arabinosyltransferase ARAD1 [Carex littledalei]|uniref:Putative arabinosyltransferase ARAD1 n=1 Tax=Carex littledalei TaxID=544730 RepID=A0A833V3N5_9POAL|nr:putative arabinosyltransferase ARAD1 [Carex littledalei]